MPLMHLGRNNLATLAIGSGSNNAYDSTGACIHVSSSTSIYATSTSTNNFTSTSTDFQNAGATLVSTMEATYPSVSTNQITFRAVFTTDNANFAWETWGISNSTSTGAGDLLNIAPESLGTKTNSQSWQFTADVTFTT